MNFISITYSTIINKTHGHVNLMFFIKLCADIYRYLADHSESNKEYVYESCDSEIHDSASDDGGY